MSEAFNLQYLLHKRMVHGVVPSPQMLEVGDLTESLEELCEPMLRVLHVHIRVHFKPLYSHLYACLGSSLALQYLVKFLSDGLVSISLGEY